MVEPAVTLLGSAAVPWPVPGCGCRHCLVPGVRVRPSSIRVGGVTLPGPPVGVGEARQRDGVRLAGLPGPSGGVVVVLAAPGAGTVLWAPEPGPLPEATLDALAGGGLDVVALGTGPDGSALAGSLALLRRAGALADGCDVVAVGLDHAISPPRLRDLLRGWGARLAPDGAPLGRAHAVPAPPPPRRTLILGAASSGKSALAEALLGAEPYVDYLPTGPAAGPDDHDWAARVAAHRDRRPGWWQTLEGVGAADELGRTGAPLLLDSVGTWVSGALERCGAWNDVPGWRQGFEAEVDRVVRAWRGTRRQVVAVAEETGWGVVPGTPAGRVFRDCLGTVNRRLAAESERVLLVVAGRVLDLAEGIGDV